MAVQAGPQGIGYLEYILNALNALEDAGTISSGDTLATIQSTLETLMDQQGA